MDRRDFLRRSGALGIGVTAPTLFGLPGFVERVAAAPLADTIDYAVPSVLPQVINVFLYGGPSELAALAPDARAAHDAALAAHEREAALYRRVADLNVAELLDYLFLAAVQRRARAEEQEALHGLLFAEGHLDDELANRFVRDDRLDDVALIALDYLSRLPEAYYLPALR